LVLAAPGWDIRPSDFDMALPFAPAFSWRPITATTNLFRLRSRLRNNQSVQLRFLVGPAGSGKTFRCLAEIRRALAASPEGPPLLFIAPKQSTLQLEQQLLAEPALPGYTRLEICSFERLAYRVFDWLQKAPPRMLGEEGRTMVLRALLARKRNELKLFRASARLTGFARQLSIALSELERNGLTPEVLNQLALELHSPEGLSYKLQDLATLLRDYLDWLQHRDLHDSDSLLPAAIGALASVTTGDQRAGRRKSSTADRQAEFVLNDPRDREGSAPLSCHLPVIQQLWVDGFADYSAQELNLLAALAPYCERGTLTFCLEEIPPEKTAWLSHWSAIGRAFRKCQERFAGVPNLELRVEILRREAERTRFPGNPVLQHLEANWEQPRPFADSGDRPDEQAAERTKTTRSVALQTLPVIRPGRVEQPGAALKHCLRVAICADPETEATVAAREIRRFARAGARYRDISVIVRNLEGYYQPLQRVFMRFEIPFFLDRREPVSHHPLAELTRSALRTVTLGWQHEDWFGALKTGLLPVSDEEIDRLENESLARGWRGKAWQQPFRLLEVAQTSLEKERLQRLEAQLEKLRRRLVPPFQQLALVLATTANKPTGAQLAAAYRELWQTLEVEQRLQHWAEGEVAPVESPGTTSVHLTVWGQMNAWLQNVELAFTEPLPVRDWLAILEAGLGNLSVGVIPPALDQVLIGAIDRSRNPDIKLALILGLNEGVFPASPENTPLLSETDRLELERRNVLLGLTSRQQLARERFYAYIACTRPRQRLVLTCAQHDGHGATLNSSPFLGHIHRLFPSVPFEPVPKALDWRDSEHPVELIGPLLKGLGPMTKVQNSTPTTCRPPSTVRGPPSPGWEQLAALPVLAATLESLRHFRPAEAKGVLARDLAERLYGPTLKSSVSRLEQFAACPFKFFVHSGLRAEERQLFELDVKEQGSFQHDVLALFHDQLHAEGKRWRDVTAAEARKRVATIAQGLMANYRSGLLQASEQTRFLARSLTESLQDFVETLVGWMRQQYQFDPAKVELPFGQDPAAPAWTIELDGSRRLELYGRIDRIDLCRTAENEALCVVVDYKSSQKELDPLLLAHGLQLQLLTYLNVLRHWPDPQALFGMGPLVPAGVFYVNLRGKYAREANRLDALADPALARKRAYRHAGRFDSRVLRQLDSRPDAAEGDQFNYRLTRAGQLQKNSREALTTADFRALLDSLETHLKNMGRQIYAGFAEVSPYRKGVTTACDQCGYQAICRIDPWTHRYRVLRKPAE
jgi:ATP-dependent helicase/nuclease subunit B